MTLKIAETLEQRVRSDYVERNMNMQVARAEGRHAQLIEAASTRMVRPRFLDYPLIPSGVLTLIAGRAGVSKSTLSINRAALATRGRLKGDYEGHPVNVCFSGIEDSASMQKARLIAADANLTRVKFLTITDTRNGTSVETGLSIPRDLPEIRDLLKDAGIRLWVIDPITSCIPGDTNKRDDVRAALDPLAALASDLDIAIVGILHFNKGGGYASDKVSGSHAFRDAVRSLILVSKDDETGDVVMTVDKSNYTTAAGTSFSYALSSRDVQDDEGQSMSVPVVTGLMPTERTVNEIINRNMTPAQDVPRTSADEVIDWLTDYLRAGPAAFREIMKDARAEGFTGRQLTNARQKAEDPWIVTVPDPKHKGRGQRRLWMLSANPTND